MKLAALAVVSLMYIHNVGVWEARMAERGAGATPLRILHVEDDPDDTTLLERHLRRSGISATLVRQDNRGGILAALRESRFDLVLCDYNLPELPEGEAVALLQVEAPELPVIVLTGTIGEERATDLMRGGVRDLVLKDRLDRLASTISRSLEDAEERNRRRAAEARVEFLAYSDPATGLPNANVLSDEIQSRLGAGGRFTLLVLGIDRLADIRHTLGHAVASVLLLEVARRALGADARFSVRRLDTDRLACVVDEVDDGALGDLVEAVRGRVETPLWLDGFQVHVTIHVGAARAPDHATERESLTRCACVALEVAQRSTHALAMYQPERDPYSARRLQLLADLREAVYGRRLFMLYQPRVSLADGRIRGAEALCRWVHPVRGFVPPDEFIPLAESSGLIHEVTALALDTALDTCQGWWARGLRLNVAVNLSARDLIHAELPIRVAGMLERRDLPPAALHVEITESAIMQDPKRAHGTVEALRALGVSIAIDDFGVGYSSLAYLRTFPIQSLKIDKSFVCAGILDSRDQVIVRSTIDLGHRFGLEVVAEGIEDAGAVARLREWGCDSGQGYFFGRPMASDALVAMADAPSPWAVSEPA